MVLCLATALRHVLLVFLHVAPPNPLSRQYSRQVKGWVFPFFEQNWRLFAPDPESVNRQISARTMHTAPDGSDAGQRLVRSDRRRQRRRSKHDAFPSHTAQNMLRRAWTSYLETHGGDDRLALGTGADVAEVPAQHRGGPCRRPSAAAPSTSVQLRVIVPARSPVRPQRPRPRSRCRAEVRRHPLSALVEGGPPCATEQTSTSATSRRARTGTERAERTHAAARAASRIGSVPHSSCYRAARLPLRGGGAAHRLRAALPRLPAARVPAPRRDLGARTHRGRPALASATLRPDRAGSASSRSPTAGSTSRSATRLALVVSALFMLGWRTRAASVLFAVVVASFHARAIFMTDGGDNLILLMALYLVVTACGRRWSLDARRARLRASATGPVRPPAWTRRRRPAAPTRARRATAWSRCCTTAACSSSPPRSASSTAPRACTRCRARPGATGTALHYVLNLDLFRPWPALSAHGGRARRCSLAIAGYLTVLLQVAFPFVLFGRLKYPRPGHAVGHARGHRGAPGAAALLRRDDRRGRRVPAGPLLPVTGTAVATHLPGLGIRRNGRRVPGTPRTGACSE